MRWLPISSAEVKLIISLHRVLALKALLCSLFKSCSDREGKEQLPRLPAHTCPCYQLEARQPREKCSAQCTIYLPIACNVSKRFERQFKVITMDIKQDVLCDSKRGFDEVDGEEEEASKRVCSTTLDRSSTFASFTSSAADGSAEVDIERRDEAISPEVGGPPDEPLTEEHRLDTAEQKKELLNAKKEGDSAEEPTEEPLTEEHCLVKAEEEELPQKEGDSAAEPTEEPLAEEHCLVKAEEEEEKGLLNATPKMKGDSANGPLNSMQGVEFRAAFIDDLKFIPGKKVPNVAIRWCS